MMRIMCTHPISNPNGPECYDGKVHDLPADLDLEDLEQVGRWLEEKVGCRMDYRPGRSRWDREKGRCVFFPRRRQPGLHALWVEEISPSHTTSEGH